MVPEARIELAWTKVRRILSPLRLPISPPRLRTVYIGKIKNVVNKIAL
jgi:hypothetical protein